MTVVVVVLAVVVVVAGGVLLLADRARRRAVSAARRSLADRNEQVRRADADRSAAVSSGTDAERRADRATRRALEAEAIVAARVPPSEAHHRAASRLEALWLLSRLASTWERRRADAESTAPAAAGATDLAEVLDVEIGRIREEAGIPGDLEVTVEPPADPAEAILVVQAVRLLLSALVRYCDAYDLTVRRGDDRINATVICEGFDGPDSVADDTSALLVAIVAAGGDVDVDRDPEGHLRARLSLAAPIDR